MNDPVAIARNLLGTPYGHQGRAPGQLLDCIGVIITVAQGLGLQVIDQQGYAMRPDGVVLQSSLDAHLVRRPAGEEYQSGDVLLFRIGTDPQHVALYTGEGTIIHSYSGVGRVVEHILDEKWRERLVAVYAWPPGAV